MQRSDLRAQGWKYHFCQLHRGGRYEPLTKQFLYYGTLCKQIGDYLRGCILRDDL